MPNNEKWEPVLHMKDVIDSLPDGAPQDGECSIPDVYGKAIQFSLALENANINDRHTLEVDIWRGLITLLALQHYYDFPIAWEEVVMPGKKNAFCKSLEFIPDNFSIFSQPSQQLNGKNFYVLTWQKDNGDKKDLCLYSPATLVCPVADWREIFSELPEIEWFDRNSGFQRPEQVLRESDKKIVSFWLRKMVNQIAAASVSNSSNKQMVLRHCNRFLDDLGCNLQKKDLMSLKLTAINGNTGLTSVLETLNNTVQVTLQFGQSTLPGKGLFSDQICCFRNREENLFQKCSHEKNYKIAGEEGLCAFLPLHSKIRKHCGPLQLAQGISMALIKKGEEMYIRAEARLPGSVGMDLVKDYRLVEQGAAGKGEAFFYSEDKAQGPPLIAVWPSTISNVWKSFYIMIEDNYRYGSMEVARSEELKASSKYVVQTEYVPDTIPIVMRLQETQEPLSIGVITLPVKSAPTAVQAKVFAEVAVDFGTSSTRVFVKTSNREGKREIFIADDSPLIITSHGDEQNIMRDYFVASQYRADDRSEDLDNRAKKVFSIYKRNDCELKELVAPILDGVIYQAQANETLKDQKDNTYLSRLMTNLKWGSRNNSVYYEAFLKQLCLHVMNLLYQEDYVNVITWRYALPEIMEVPSKTAVETVWTKDIKTYLESMSDIIQCDIAPHHVTESEAASRYFLYDGAGNANTEKGYLVVDIGGGSTDLALWQGTDGRRELKWHTSVNMAGRSMFTRWIVKYLTNFFVTIEDTTFQNMVLDLETAGDLNEINGTRNALADRILNFYGETLLSEYIKMISKDIVDDWLLALRGKIIQGVSLLMFALGCQIGILVKAGALTVDDQSGTFVIAVGGKGSQILKWTDCAIDNDSVARTFFRLGRKAVMDGSFPHVEVQPSGDPKAEVARGLLESNRDQTSRDELRPLQRQDFERDYIELFQKFRGAYQKVFKDQYPLPETTKNCMSDALNRYTDGDRSSLVHVFMEVFYAELTAKDQVEAK